MNDDFECALAFVLETEGGYTNDPDDHGGKTNLGITQVEYTQWLKDNGKPLREVKDILEEDARQIYREYYWEAGRCGDLPWTLCVVHFDGCVNVGVGQAARFLQRAVGAKDDGLIGSRTLAKVAGATAGDGVRTVIQAVLQLRHQFYKELAAKDATQRKFLNGWLNRLVALEQWAQEAPRKTVC